MQGFVIFAFAATTIFIMIAINVYDVRRRTAMTSDDIKIEDNRNPGDMQSY